MSNNVGSLSAASRRLEVVVEEDLHSADRDRLGRLLADAFPRGAALYREKAWRSIRPSVRVIARAPTEQLIGQVSVFEIATRPALNLFGIGDLAVCKTRRREGFGRALCECATDECRRRGSEVILVRTTIVAELFRGLGFQPVGDFRFFYEDSHACHRQAHWHVLAGDLDMPPRIALAHGDF